MQEKIICLKGWILAQSYHTMAARYLATGYDRGQIWFSWKGESINLCRIAVMCHVFDSLFCRALWAILYPDLFLSSKPHLWPIYWRLCLWKWRWLPAGYGCQQVLIRINELTSRFKWLTLKMCHYISLHFFLLLAPLNSESSEKSGSVMVPLPPGEKESWGAITGTVALVILVVLLLALLLLYRHRQRDKENNTPTVSFSTSRTVNSEYAIPGRVQMGFLALHKVYLVILKSALKAMHFTLRIFLIGFFPDAAKKYKHTICMTDAFGKYRKTHN